MHGLISLLAAEKEGKQVPEEDRSKIRSAGGVLRRVPGKLFVSIEASLLTCFDKLCKFLSDRARNKQGEADSRV